MKHLKGFTLIELLVTLALVVVFAALAVPSFSSLIRSNRITAQANEFAASLSIARSEAIRRGTPVAVTSQGGNDWSQGWTVSVVAPVTVLRNTDAFANDLNFTSAGGSNVFTFTSRGFLTNAASADSLTLCNPDLAEARLISVGASGRISVVRTEDGTSNCP